MNANDARRPLAVALLGWLFVIVGCGSVVRGSWLFLESLRVVQEAARRHDLLDLTLVAISGLIAIVGGAFLLLGRSWARWVLLGWMGAHVVLSLVHSTVELAVHAAMFVALVVILRIADVRSYFRTAAAEQ